MLLLLLLMLTATIWRQFYATVVRFKRCNASSLFALPENLTRYPSDLQMNQSRIVMIECVNSAHFLRPRYGQLAR